MTLTEQHDFVCHSDGSVCEDGCDVAPLPGKLEELDVMLSGSNHNRPEPGTWADVARFMSISFPNEGVDWDAWKDQMKEQDY